MSKKNPEEQRRKKKRAEEKRKARQSESLAYLGNKYKNARLAPLWKETEIAIYQTFVLTGRKLTDRMVTAAVESLIRQMRAGLSPSQPEGDIIYDIGREEDLLIDDIRRSWTKYFAVRPWPPKDDLIGVLRSILGTMDGMKSANPQSQSYLRHIAEFLTERLGIRVQVVKEGEPLPQPLVDPRRVEPQ